MNHFRLLPRLAAAFLATASLLPGQPNAPKILDDDFVPPWQMKFENLDPKVRKDYQKHLFEASRLFNQKRIIEALNEVAKARKIFDGHDLVHDAEASGDGREVYELGDTGVSLWFEGGDCFGVQATLSDVESPYPGANARPPAPSLDDERPVGDSGWQWVSF